MNFIFVNPDIMHDSFVGCCENPAVRTPSIDRLANTRDAILFKENFRDFPSGGHAIPEPG